ncbi:MAG: tRNA (adenosine(37)-N6)-threonylcarbamoyltransferase complex dimerization subunit type 1 TsaB [Oscillospiraceae bacterium]|nr:tRNA (adenosine(37)-N6)-threonylcarbamoyltransferase complex dimerization subunit type 1 TsaB [Oscillospiraceae bacterium]
MLILGIDTTTKTASTAVVNFGGEKPRDFTVLSEMQSCGRISHSENLMPMIDYTLKCAGVALSEIDLFAVANGPGSFTGIRIGVATVKGLAFGSDSNNCIGISPLYALAYNFYGYNNIADFLILPAIDARRKQVYNSVFDSKLNYLKKDRIITVGDLETELNAEFAGRRAIFTGDGADMCYSEIDFAGKIQVPEILKKPSASSLCRIAYGSRPVHARALAPSYLIKTQAEREFDLHEK